LRKNPVSEDAMTNHQIPNLKHIGWVLALLGVALLAVWGGRLARAGLSLREHLAQAQTLTDAPEAVDPAMACGLVLDLRDDVVALRQQAGFLVHLAPALGWLPKVGGDLEAAPHLLVMADGLTEAGRLACDTLGPALAAFEGTGEASGGLSLELVAYLLAEERPDLEQALAAVEQAQEAWAQVDAESLSPWLAGKTALLEQGLPLLWAGLRTATVAPDLLGMDGPRIYLILAQNEDELRPTGGFISGAGRLKLDGGRIAELDFLDANIVDDWAHKPYSEPPEPLLNYMRSEMWLFRDANWSPDFPTSARQAAYLYEYGQGVPINGVIALDQYAVALLMTGLGEMHVPGVPEPVTVDNVRQFMRAAWNPDDTGVNAEWVLSRKDFIGRWAAAIRERVENDPRSVDWVQIAKVLYRALEGRHLLVFVDDVDVSSALAQVGWDGALRESAGDHLMIVDANLGFNKVNPLISESAGYRVVLRPDGTAAAELSLAYAHQGRKADVHCQHQPTYAGDLTYEALIHRCYYDYLRVYVPAGSVLRAATPHPVPGGYLLRGEPDDGQAVALSDEAGKTVFAQFFVVEYGQTLTTRFEYDLPRVARLSKGQWHYVLLVQKQPGTDSTPVSLTLALPPGAQLLAATPSPRMTDKETLTFDLSLDTDIVVEVVYEYE
jgi:hypothetical protein